MSLSDRQSRRWSRERKHRLTATKLHLLFFVFFVEPTSFVQITSTSMLTLECQQRRAVKSLSRPMSSRPLQIWESWKSFRLKDIMFQGAWNFFFVGSAFTFQYLFIPVTFDDFCCRQWPKCAASYPAQLLRSCRAAEDSTSNCVQLRW